MIKYVYGAVITALLGYYTYAEVNGVIYSGTDGNVVRSGGGYPRYRRSHSYFGYWGGK